MADEKEMNAAEETEEVREEPETEETAVTAEAEKPADEAEESEKAGDEEIETVEAEVVDDDAAETKGKRFWQKQGKTAKKDKKDEMIAELSDKVQRQLAEFENFRKRTEKEKAQNYMVGAKDVLEKMLPILDNFERGLAGADMEDPFAQGMEKVYRQMLTAFEQLGVTPMDAVGKEFDPNFHNAVMQVEDESLGANVVAEELQKGYMYKDQVLRYAMVKVAN